MNDPNIEKNTTPQRYGLWIAAGALVAKSLVDNVIDNVIDETKIVPNTMEFCQELCSDGIEMVNDACDHWPEGPYTPHDSDPCLPPAPQYYATTTTTTTEPGDYGYSLGSIGAGDEEYPADEGNTVDCPDMYAYQGPLGPSPEMYDHPVQDCPGIEEGEEPGDLTNLA